MMVIYSKFNFNEYGDEVSHLKFEVTGEIPLLNISKQLNISSMNKFRNIINGWEKRRVKVFIKHPCTYDVCYNEHESIFRECEFSLKSMNVIYIDDPLSSIYPRTMIFDTVYHLNKKGNIESSFKLLYLLRSLLMYDDKPQ